MTKKMNQFLRHCITGGWFFSWFNIGPKSFHNRYRLLEESARSRLCGFALAFDRHAKSLASNFSAYSSSCTSEISCSLFFKFVTNLFESMRDFWPKSENCLCSQKYIFLISTPYLPCNQQVAISNTGSILVFPWIHPLGCDASSSLGRVYSRQATASVNCENSAVSFRHEILSDFNCSKESCINTKSAQSVLLW